MVLRTVAAETSVRKLELKVCERCGGLWLRDAGSGGRYCRPCEQRVADLPEVKVRRARDRGLGAIPLAGAEFQDGGSEAAGGQR